MVAHPSCPMIDDLKNGDRSADTWNFVLATQAVSLMGNLSFYETDYKRNTLFLAERWFSVNGCLGFGQNSDAYIVSCLYPTQPHTIDFIRLVAYAPVLISNVFLHGNGVFFSRQEQNTNFLNRNI